MPRGSTRWQAFIVLAVAFLLLGAAGDGDVTLVIAVLGFSLSIGGAGVGFGITKAQANAAKERAEQAHDRIGNLEADLVDRITSLTEQFANMRVELAQAGAMRAQPREHRT